MSGDSRIESVDELEDCYSSAFWMLLAACRLEAQKAGYSTSTITRANASDVGWCFNLARDPLTVHHDPATVAVRLSLLPGGAFFDFCVFGQNRGADTVREFVIELIVTPRTHAAMDDAIRAIIQPSLLEKAAAVIAVLAPKPSPKHWSPR